MTMNKLGMVLGIAAVAAIAGCKDPNWNRKPSQNSDAKDISTDVAPTKSGAEGEKSEVAPTPIVVEKTCTCAPGTVHESPCMCGAPDCKCVVVQKTPVKPTTAPEPEFTTYIVQRGDYLAKISKKYNVTINSIKELNGLKGDMIRVGQKLKLPGNIDVGEQTVPAGAYKAPAKKVYSSYSGATKEYVVKSGDTLGAIAYGNGINVRQLKELNGLSSDTIRIGQKLKIPATKVVKSAPKAQKKAEKKAAKKDEKKPVEEKTEAAPAPEAAPVADKPTEASADPAADIAAPVEAAPSAETTAAPAEAPAEEQTYIVQEGEDLADVSIRWGVSAAAVCELNNLNENDKLKAGQVLKLPADAQQN
ncbi:MAG: LysM peptidoglycan-binding domain-containing protein [Kiritimatiellae bacterium]|nr:LysM peptidoglycan-binding domain-containing protein [Kiritimatiellia bacterium]